MAVLFESPKRLRAPHACAYAHVSIRSLTQVSACIRYANARNDCRAEIAEERNVEVDSLNRLNG